jgi:hypothetical protein
VLDTNVTRDIGHLTKVPFACHAETGRVACAVSAASAEELVAFDPSRDAPSLVLWNQETMDNALRHFDDGATDAREPEEPEEPEVAVLSDKIMAELERKAEKMCDVEDLAGAARRHPRVPTDRAPRQALPRKVGFKRKPSPLAPDA